MHTLMDVFLAGSETTSTTLTWAVLYMARYPEVQAKVQEELDMVVGSGRLPSLQDKPLLPYTEAVVMEIQRYANIVPSGVNHTSHRDIEVNGQLIPAGALVLPLMAEILKVANSTHSTLPQGPYWGDGETFRPERFLDSEGKCRKDDHLIPFSIGGIRGPKTCLLFQGSASAWARPSPRLSSSSSSPASSTSSPSNRRLRASCLQR